MISNTSTLILLILKYYDTTLISVGSNLYRVKTDKTYSINKNKNIILVS